MIDLEKRKWHYAQHPFDFEISDCECGTKNVWWSEFKEHLWCYICEKDFKPADNGVFGGPVSPRLCKLIGITFDRVNLETGETEIFDWANNQYLRPDGTKSELK